MDKKILFSYQNSSEILEGSLFYISSDYALTYKFFSEAQKKNDMIFSLSFGTLEIFIDLRSRVFLYPQGYFPNTSWIEKKLPEKIVKRAKVYIEDFLDLDPGISIEYLKSRTWKRLYDSTTGWIYYGPNELENCDVNIEFANNSIVSILDGEIYSLWFKPALKY